MIPSLFLCWLLVSRQTHPVIVCKFSFLRPCLKGLLCSLSLCHDRSSQGDMILPHESLVSKMKSLSEVIDTFYHSVLLLLASSLLLSLKRWIVCAVVWE